jgi:hypothetical protein
MLAGCGGGGPGGDVTLAAAGGTVTFKGSPLAGASVTFIPEKGPLATGTTDLAGKFKLSTGGTPGVAVGESMVTVSLIEGGGGSTKNDIGPPKSEAERDAYFKKQQELMSNAFQGGGDAKSAGPKSVIPERYARKDTSKLSFKVEKDASKNEFDIKLEE